MMMMPTGPPALLISGLAELSTQVSKSEKMAIAKMLAVSFTTLSTLLVEPLSLCLSGKADD